MLARAEQAEGVPILSLGQRAVLEALRGFDEDVLLAVAPHVHDLARRCQSGAELDR